MPPSVVSSLQPLAAKEGFYSLGTLQIEKKIGQGQFSVVFRARSAVNSACVALKKIQVDHFVIVRWWCVCIHKLNYN